MITMTRHVLQDKLQEATSARFIEHVHLVPHLLDKREDLVFDTFGLLEPQEPGSRLFLFSSIWLRSSVSALIRVRIRSSGISPFPYPSISRSISRGTTGSRSRTSASSRSSPVRVADPSSLRLPSSSSTDSGTTLLSA